MKIAKLLLLGTLTFNVVSLCACSNSKIHSVFLDSLSLNIDKNEAKNNEDFVAKITRNDKYKDYDLPKNIESISVNDNVIPTNLYNYDSSNGSLVIQKSAIIGNVVIVAEVDGIINEGNIYKTSFSGDSLTFMTHIYSAGTYCVKSVIKENLSLDCTYHIISPNKDTIDVKYDDTFEVEDTGLYEIKALFDKELEDVTYFATITKVREIDANHAYLTKKDNHKYVCFSFLGNPYNPLIIDNSNYINMINEDTSLTFLNNPLIFGGNNSTDAFCFHLEKKDKIYISNNAINQSFSEKTIYLLVRIDNVVASSSSFYLTNSLVLDTNQFSTSKIEILQNKEFYFYIKGTIYNEKYHINYILNDESAKLKMNILSTNLDLIANSNTFLAKKNGDVLINCACESISNDISLEIIRFMCNKLVEKTDKLLVDSSYNDKITTFSFSNLNLDKTNETEYLYITCVASINIILSIQYLSYSYIKNEEKIYKKLSENDFVLYSSEDKKGFKGKEDPFLENSNSIHIEFISLKFSNIIQQKEINILTNQ